MNGSSRTTTFMKSPLVTWVKTLQGDEKCSQKEIKDYIELSSGNFLHKVWLQIDPQPPFQSVSNVIEETGSRIRNLTALLNNIKAFYENVLGQILVLKLPDVIKIASNSNDECSSCEEMRVLLLLLLGCAVQCERKEHFIDGIKQLDISVQHAIVECIQQITDNPESVWLNSEWSLLPEEEHEKEKLYTILVQHINKLVKERDELCQRIVDLAFELDNICPNTSSQMSATSTESCNSLFISSPNIMNSGEQKSHIMVELADVKSKLRRVQQELEEKNEIVSELKEILEQNKESCNKLRQDNLELIQEARSAKAYRDEIDVLNERVRKVDRLENEVQRYRDKMNELDFYKSRVEELREDNRILSETKVMLEEQLDGSRKRADQLPELEAQIMKSSAYTNELNIQRDLDRNQIERLIEEITHLRLDKKSTADELTKVQSELTNLRCQMKMDLLHQNGEGNLLEQINNDASKRVLKLELENQRLQSLMENIKNNRTSDTTTSFLNNNHYSNRISADDIPNGNYTDDMLSPGDIDMSITSDSASLSLSADFSAKLEKIENQNECLRNTVERVKRAELKITELEIVRNDLQNELKDLKSKRNGDSIKFEQIERNASQLLTENQRLQRLMDNKGKRYEEAQHEIQALESENQKLLATAETLKSSVKRLNDLEREVTNLEAENHRLEQEKKSAEKEILRLKQAIDAKDSTIDDYATRMSTIELENKRIRKDSDNNSQTAIKLKEMEKVNKQISNELFVSKKTVTTLRQDLVNEKIKSQQLSCELERVNNALEKIWQQKTHLDNTLSLNTDSLNKDWTKLLEDIFDNIVKKSLEQKEIKISALENSVSETMNKNVELNNTIQSLKRRIDTTADETQPTVNHNLVSELQRKVTLIEDENKNLKNENITQKDTIIDIMTKYKTLESTLDSINNKNTELQSDQAKLQVENSLIKSQNSSIHSQTTNLQTQIVSIQETRDELQRKCEEFDTNYRILLNDHEALQILHQQLTADYETQSSNSSALKLLYKNLRAEHKAVQEKLQAWLVSQEELQKMKDEIESRGNCEDSKTNVEFTKIEEENKVLNEEHKRLQTEYKMLQNIYKKLRTENNDLKLKHTELQGETAECRDKMSLLDVEVSKLSNYCEMVALTNNSLECHRKRLISNMSNLLSQYHELLNEIADDSEKLITDKMHDLCAKKDKLEEMIKEYDVTLEKKKVAVTNPNVVRRIHRSSTDLCLSKNQNIHLKDRNSAPIDNLIDEAIYGRIWEAETPPIPSNTAILRPFRSHNPSTLALEPNNTKLMENIKQTNIDSITQTTNEMQKPERNCVISPVPPPRPPPRVSTTIENKMTISLITSPTRSSTLNNSSTSCETTPNSGSTTTRSNSYLYNNNFTRGTFKSNSINYGSPIRRQRDHHLLKNGHHHIHHFHHMHPHSASPSLHSDSSLTPVEDSELSDNAVNLSHRSRNLNNVDNVTVNSSATNSIWYEYGCV